MKEFYKANEKWIMKILVLVGVVSSIFLFVKYIFKYVIPFVFGFILSLLLSPLADLLQKTAKKLTGGKFFLSRGIASIISILLVLFTISVVGSSIVVRVVEEGRALSLNMPIYIEQVRVTFNNINEKYDAIYDLIPMELRELTAREIDNLLKSMTSSIGSSIKNGTVNLVIIVPQVILTTLFTLISAFFFIKDKELIRKVFRENSPPAIKRSYKSIRTGLGNTIAGYIRAQLTLMSITGLIAIIGLTIIGYPYSLLIGLLISFVDALPILGSGFILWPWAAYSLIIGNYSRAAYLLIIYGTITVVRQSLEPKVLGGQIGLHPILTLMAIYVGLGVFGPLGVVAGPLTLVVSKSLLEISFKE